VIGNVLAQKGGRALAGLALFASLAACDDGSDARGPAAPSEGENAALQDAREMLDERQPVENAAEAEPDEASEKQAALIRMQPGNVVSFET